jgi:hypothetical protein
MFLSYVAATMTLLQGKDFKLTPLPDGFVQVVSKEYSIEVPKAWTVGNQTPWGARSITQEKKAETELGVMTAGVTNRSWEELYRTSLFFIMRQEKGKATPYKVGKTKTGYESCSFDVANEKGFVRRKFVLLKNSAGAAIALSVTIGDPKDEKEMTAYFNRMVETAKVFDPK